MVLSSLTQPKRHWSSLRLYRRCSISFILINNFTIIALIFLRLKVPLLLRISSETKRGNNKISYEALQRCIDLYTSNGAWDGSRWRVKDYPTTCRFQEADSDNNDDLANVAAPFQLVKVGFMGDSTTRSDLRAWEEAYQCPRTNLDEAQVFQRKNEQGRYICQAWEQSIDLTKCGVPPVAEVTDCPHGVSFRYFYKIYPWTPLDQWYFSQLPDLFQDIDVLVISLGRWFYHYQPSSTFNVTEHFETFLIELKKVFSGVILYQSEYPIHLAKSADLRYPVQCTPRAICFDCGSEQYECSQTVEEERPQRDIEMRSVLERHRILYLDRWNISKSLPLEYFQPWYCHNGTTYEWYCNHHLGIVALQHMRLIANVIKNLFML